MAAVPSYVAGKVAGTHPEFKLGNNAIRLINSPLVAGGRAYTLGNVQVYGVGEGPEKYTDPSYTGRRVNNGLHEERHSYQAQVLGPAYRPLQLGGMLLGDHNPADIDADNYAVSRQGKGD